MTAPSTVNHGDIEHKVFCLKQVAMAIAEDLFTPSAGRVEGVLSLAGDIVCNCHLQALWALARFHVHTLHHWDEDILAYDLRQMVKTLRRTGMWT